MFRRGGLGSFVLGGAIGAVAALLFAPKKGEELREQLFEKGMDILTDSQGLKESVTGFVSNIKHKEEEFFNEEEDSDIVIKRDFNDDEEFKNEDLSQFKYTADENNQKEPEKDAKEDYNSLNKTEELKGIRSNLTLNTNYSGTQTPEQKRNEDSAGEVNDEAREREEQNEVPENMEEKVKKAVDKAHKENKSPKQEKTAKEDKSSKDNEKVKYQEKGFKNQPHISKEDEE